MTIAMADSISITNLPAGWAAYAGYVAGNWVTYPQLKIRFPKAHLLSITPFANFDAECCDCENGDLTPPQVPAWVRRQITRGEKRPCVYASVSAMGAIAAELKGAGISRAQVRCWSAHYGLGRHICGPATCKQTSVAMDGTQWTDIAPGAHGSQIDASLLHDDFFTGGTPAVSATGPEKWDNADWIAFRTHSLYDLTRALTGNVAGVTGDPGAVSSAHAGFLGLVPSAEQIAQAVIKALPPAQAGGLSQAEVQAAVQAVFAKAAGA